MLDGTGMEAELPLRRRASLARDSALLLVVIDGVGTTSASVFVVVDAGTTSAAVGESDSPDTF